MDLTQRLNVTCGNVPIGLQLKEQIRWLIVREQLRPGDLLPSVRDLSEALGIARNTINAVYDELRDEGLITMGRGRGTEVADSDRVRQMPRLAGLLDTLDQAFDAAVGMGYAPDEIAPAAQVRAHLLLTTPQEAPITLVESLDREVDWYVRQVREITGRRVRLLPLDVFKQNTCVAGKAFVTSCFNSQEIRELSPCTEVDVAYLGTAPDMRTVIQVAQLPPGARVLFVGLTEGAGQWMKRQVAAAGVEHLQLEATALSAPDCDARLAAASVIYAAYSAFDEAVRRAPAGANVRPFELVLDSGTKERLRSFASRHA